MITIALVLVGIFAVAYIGYQVYDTLNDPVQTVSALYTTVEDSFEVTGFYVRDEDIVRTSTSGEMEILLDEGEKTSRDGTVAAIYADAESLGANKRIRELNKKIDELEYIVDSSQIIPNIEIYDKRLSDSMTELKSMICSSGMRNLSDRTFDLKANLLKREMISYDTDALKSSIVELKAQLETEARTKSNAIAYVHAESSGYFSYSVDGYEELLNPETVADLTPSMLETMKAETVENSDKVVGKIIKSYVWYFAALVPESELDECKVGNYMNVRFDGDGDNIISVKVTSISDVENGMGVVVFRSDRNVNGCTSARKIAIDVVLKSYTGLKIPKSALRFDENNVEGVFCMVDSKAVFRKVTRVFDRDTYYIVKYDPTNTDGLMPNDQVIISGLGLEDGQIIK